MQDMAPLTEDVQGDLSELPEEYVWLEGGQAFIACAFYTANYLPQILSLKCSLEALGINHYFKRYERAATWEATTRLKPVFVAHCLERFPNKDVLYLDADAVVRKPLDFFGSLQTDICILFDPTKLGGKSCLRIAAGTLFIRNTEGGRRFSRLWKDAERFCKPLTLDEDMIYMAFEDMSGITMTVLPPAYSKIFDKPGVEPIIEHFQASRGQFKWRRLIRRARRAGMMVGGAAAATLAWWIGQHLTWVS